MTIPAWLALVIVIVVSAVVGLVLYKKGYEDRKKAAEAQIGSAEEESKRMQFMNNVKYHSAPIKILSYDT